MCKKIMIALMLTLLPTTAQAWHYRSCYDNYNSEYYEYSENHTYYRRYNQLHTMMTNRNNPNLPTYTEPRGTVKSFRTRIWVRPEEY